jgi:AbrB family looped-hinge helix DNA binding protein
MLSSQVFFVPSVFSVVNSLSYCAGEEGEHESGCSIARRYWKWSCHAEETLVGYSYQEIIMASRLTTLEYLATTKIGEKGQLTVPKQFREDLGLGTGAPFAVLRLGDGLVLLPEQRRFQHLCDQVSETLTGAGITPEAVLETLPEARNRVFKRHYKKSGPSKKTSRRRSIARR